MDNKKLNLKDSIEWQKRNPKLGLVTIGAMMRYNEMRIIRIINGMGT